MKAITDRRSIRKYKDIPLEEEKINDILRAAVLAPSAKNRQPWKFIVYRGEAKKRLVAAMETGIKREQSGITDLPGFAYSLPDAAHTLEIMKAAPVLVAVLNTNGGTFYEEIGAEQRIVESCDSLSIGASIENLILKATELGLGTLWIANTFFAYPELVEYIGTEHQLVSAIALGYPAEEPNARPRKPLEEILEFM